MDEAILDEEEAAEKGYGTIASAAIPKVCVAFTLTAGSCSEY